MTRLDLAQQMHELARYRLTIDEAAFVLGIPLPEAFNLADWYCVNFDGVPVDLAEVKRLTWAGWNYEYVARELNCSTQKIAALAKANRRAERMAAERLAA